MKSVCPALVVVAHDMLTYSCPLTVVLGRMNVISLDVALIFDGNAKPEIGGNPIFAKCFYKLVGEGEIVGVGGVRV